VRVLVTNDDGIHAPGLAALVRALALWQASGEDREVVVVAPLANHSGASAAVGTVYERQAITFRTAHFDGADGIPAFAVDTPPALAVIIAVFGAFGPTPDLVISGINLGINAGRSILHSGTVGAALTAAQHGIRGLAVSLRARPEPSPWETAAQAAIALLPSVMSAPERTVFNLNVPAVPIEELRGVRRATVSQAGIVKSAVAHFTDDSSGEVDLELGFAAPSSGGAEPDAISDDVSLVASGFASLSALRGASALGDEETIALVGRAALDAEGLLGIIKGEVPGR
jgi:5'-nucleotidase